MTAYLPNSDQPSCIFILLQPLSEREERKWNDRTNQMIKDRFAHSLQRAEVRKMEVSAVGLGESADEELREYLISHWQKIVHTQSIICIITANYGVNIFAWVQCVAGYVCPYPLDFCAHPAMSCLLLSLFRGGKILSWSMLCRILLKSTQMCVAGYKKAEKQI